MDIAEQIENLRTMNEAELLDELGICQHDIDNGFTYNNIEDLILKILSK